MEKTNRNAATGELKETSRLLEGFDGTEGKAMNH
jgi:hypothetical protein